MPLLMTEEHWAAWLDPDEPDVGALLTDPPLDLVESLELRPVSTKVNNVRNNGPDLLAREEPVVELDLFNLDQP